MDKLLAIITTVIIIIAAIGGTVAYQAIVTQPTQPTATPTPSPTSNPTTNPTSTPTLNPTQTSTSNPTANPTQPSTPTATSSPTPSPTPNPIASFQLQNGYSDIGTLDFACWVDVNITRIPNLSGVYFTVEYKEHSDTTWLFSIINQPNSGDITYKTPPLMENTLYDFRVSWSQFGPTPPSEIQQIQTKANTVPYPAPTHVEADGIIDGVLVTWYGIGTQYPYANYIVYNNTVNDPSTATKLVRTTETAYTWTIPNSSSYVPQYFWVSSISPSNIESVKVQANT